MQVKRFNDVYVVHLQPDDEIIASLKKFAVDNNIKGASVQGIGTTKHIILGYFDTESKGYNTMETEEDMELISAIGSISTLDDDVVVHLHGTFGDDEFKLTGGHILSADILATGEFFVYPTGGTITRKHNDDFDLNLFDL